MSLFLFLLYVIVFVCQEIDSRGQTRTARMDKLWYITAVYSSSSNWKDFCAIQNDYIYSLFLHCGLW